MRKKDRSSLVTVHMLIPVKLSRVHRKEQSALATWLVVHLLQLLLLLRLCRTHWVTRNSLLLIRIHSSFIDIHLWYLFILLPTEQHPEESFLCWLV
jgi:hypothetical protein